MVMRLFQTPGETPGKTSGSTPWPPEVEELYLAERVRFVRLAYLFTGRHDVAEEIVQDAFMACAPRWDRIDRPRSYLRTAVANGARDWLRRTKLDRERSEPAVTSQDMEPDELWDALGRLEPRRRVAIVLRFYEDVPDADIADVLRCRPATVRSLIHRGLNDLRREIAND